MQNWGLVDLGVTEDWFTWYRNASSGLRIGKRLDRGLSDCVWQDMFTEATVEVLCKIYSDHSPLLLWYESPLPVEQLGTLTWTIKRQFKRPGWRKFETLMIRWSMTLWSLIKKSLETFFTKKRLFKARIKGVKR